MFPSSNSETTATHGEHPKNRGKSSIAGWHAVQVMRKRCLRTIVSIWCSWNMYIYITITVYLWNICCSHTKNLEESSNEAVLDSCPGNWLVISSIRTCSDMIYIYIYLYLFRPSQRKCSHTFSYWILITHRYAQKRTASMQGVAEWLVVQLYAKY